VPVVVHFLPTRRERPARGVVQIASTGSAGGAHKPGRDPGILNPETNHAGGAARRIRATDSVFTAYAARRTTSGNAGNGNAGYGNVQSGRQQTERVACVAEQAGEHGATPDSLGISHAVPDGPHVLPVSIDLAAQADLGKHGV